jgi:hypothetical protein
MSGSLPSETVQPCAIVTDDEVLDDRADEAEQYTGLADLIRWENPYGYEASLPQDLDAGTDTTGLTSQCNASNPFSRTIQDLDSDELSRLMRWKFGEDEVVISKAIRVPYTYLRTKDGVQQRVTSSILIGYNGPGPA